MDEIKSVAKLVKNALETDDKTRNSDDYLYYFVCREVLKNKDIDIKTIPFETALLWRNVYKLPPFETVRRARQKIQSEIPELCGTETVRRKRAEKMIEYRGFALAGAVKGWKENG